MNNDIERENRLDESLSGQSQDERLLQSAADSLHGYAVELKLSHTLESGEWPDEEESAKAHHDHMMALAKGLDELRASCQEILDDSVHIADSLKMVASGRAARTQPEQPSAGVVPENRREFWQELEAFVDDFIEGYEFRGDDGDYVPSDRERFLIEDCVAGLLHDMGEKGFLTAAPTAPAVQGGGVQNEIHNKIAGMRAMLWRYDWRTARNRSEMGVIMSDIERLVLTHPHNGEQGGEWVRCDERLPTEADADFSGNVTWWTNPYSDLRPEGWEPEVMQWNPKYWEGGCLDKLPEDLYPNTTHWKPTGLTRPQPPTSKEGRGHE